MGLDSTVPDLANWTFRPLIGRPPARFLLRTRAGGVPARRRSAGATAQDPRREDGQGSAEFGHGRRAGWSEGVEAGTGVVSDGSYGIPEGLVAGFPVASRNGQHEIVRGLEIDEFGRHRIDRSVTELLEERDLVIKSGLVPAA